MLQLWTYLQMLPKQAHNAETTMLNIAEMLRGLNYVA